MADWNETFIADPVKFASAHALYPVEADAATHLTQRIKPKEFGQNQEKLQQIGGEGKVSYCTIIPAPETSWSIGGDGIADYKKDHNLYVMHITSDQAKKTSFPVYFLPWNIDSNFRMKLKPSRKHAMTDKDGIIIDPDFFITSALQGCTVIVEGDRQEPVVYHLNASSVSNDSIYDTDAVRARRAAQEKLDDMNRRHQVSSQAHDKVKIPPTGVIHPPKQANMRNYMPDALTPKRRDELKNKYQDPSKFWNPVSSFSKWLWEMEDFYVFQFGTVFGVRKDQEWTFYRQTRNRVTYTFRPTQWVPWGTQYQTQYYDEWCDMKCVQFWP